MNRMLGMPAQMPAEAVNQSLETQWISLERHLSDHIVSVSRQQVDAGSLGKTFNISPEVMY